MRYKLKTTHLTKHFVDLLPGEVFYPTSCPHVLFMKTGNLRTDNKEEVLFNSVSLDSGEFSCWSNEQFVMPVKGCFIEE